MLRINVLPFQVKCAIILTQVATYTILDVQSPFFREDSSGFEQFGSVNFQFARGYAQSKRLCYKLAT